MRKSRLSQEKQDRLIEYFVSGATARTAAALVDVHRNTAALTHNRCFQLTLTTLGCTLQRYHLRPYL
jgi:transposase-like protein